MLQFEARRWLIFVVTALDDPSGGKEELLNTGGTCSPQYQLPSHFCHPALNLSGSLWQTASSPSVSCKLLFGAADMTLFRCT